jgi:hypothetical protein
LALDNLSGDICPTASNRTEAEHVGSRTVKGWMNSRPSQHLRDANNERKVSYKHDFAKWDPPAFAASGCKLRKWGHV